MSGLNLAKKVGLQLHEGKIICERVTCGCTLSDVEKILAEKFTDSRAVFIAWQIQSVVWGTCEGGKLNLRDKTSPKPENWLECRIFNATEEIHLKRRENILSGRYIKDVEGEGKFYVDSFSRLWGECDKKFSAADGYVNLLDRGRKLYMEIPCEKGGAKYYGLLTRNYIDSDENTGLSGYTDCRFVAIEPAEEVK